MLWILGSLWFFGGIFLMSIGFDEMVGDVLYNEPIYPFSGGERAFGYVFLIIWPITITAVGLVEVCIVLLKVGIYIWETRSKIW